MAFLGTVEGADNLDANNVFETNNLDFSTSGIHSSSYDGINQDLYGHAILITLKDEHIQNYTQFQTAVLYNKYDDIYVDSNGNVSTDTEWKLIEQSRIMGLRIEFYDICYNLIANSETIGSFSGDTQSGNIWPVYRFDGPMVDTIYPELLIERQSRSGIVSSIYDLINDTAYSFTKVLAI